MAVPVWRLDSTRFPLVIANVVGGDGRTPPELGSLTRILDELRSLRGKRVVVVDLTFAVPDASRRKLVVDWAKANWASTRGEILAIACIAPGAFQRSILTAMLWFVQPLCPVEVFEQGDAAVRYAQGVLEKNGFSVPGGRAAAGPSP